MSADLLDQMRRMARESKKLVCAHRGVKDVTDDLVTRVLEIFSDRSNVSDDVRALVTRLQQAERCLEHVLEVDEGYAYEGCFKGWRAIRDGDGGKA